MTQEEKDLLLRDLSSRLPYGVKVHITNEWFYDKIEPYDRRLDCDVIKHIRENRYTVKPYLRPMSSMTEEEREELCELCEFFEPYNDRDDFSHYGIEIIEEFCVNDEKIPLREINYKVIDWLNKNHFDYRGLIEKGLALEAPEGMYKTK